MSAPKAFITGITGQDGSYLAELLLDIGYEVHGLVRRSSTFNTGRINHIFDRLRLHYGDLTDGSGLARLLAKIEPQEIYNLGAQSHVKVSFDCPEYTCDADALGTIRLLEAIRSTLGNSVRFYQASSSEMFGKVLETPQSENTPFNPQSPYACAKVFSYWAVKNYSQAYGLHASNGILFNHESPRRGETFVTRKITRAVSRILYGLQKHVVLGNLDAKRDWGHAWDYVCGMHLMLQKDTPWDYVLATGEQHSVRDFLACCLRYAGLIGKDDPVDNYVLVDPKYYRPTEVDSLLGDPGRAHRYLGWRRNYTFDGLVKDMMDHDLELAWAEARCD